MLGIRHERTASWDDTKGDLVFHFGGRPVNERVLHWDHRVLGWDIEGREGRGGLVGEICAAALYRAPQFPAGQQG